MKEGEGKEEEGMRDGERREGEEKRKRNDGWRKEGMKGRRRKGGILLQRFGEFMRESSRGRVSALRFQVLGVYTVLGTFADAKIKVVRIYQNVRTLLSKIDDKNTHLAKNKRIKIPTLNSGITAEIQPLQSLFKALKGI
ncbi:hypothetical protein I3843_01G160700 [Carya illinoinensis]|nr:hypothetical protein I3843_01G160700 [Carya illinoinensis]